MTWFSLFLGIIDIRIVGSSEHVFTLKDNFRKIRPITEKNGPHNVCGNWDVSLAKRK